MKIVIKEDDTGKPIGWSITAETEEEITNVNDIRNLVWFGLDDTEVVYNGRTGGTSGNAGTLHWAQKKHKNIK